MDKAERIKRATWRVARRAFEMGDWALYHNAGRAERLVETANVVVTSLADAGCLDDAYGDEGSFELDLATGYVAKESAQHIQFGAASLLAYRQMIFEKVRKLDAAGILSPADRKRSRTFAFDREEAETAKRKAAEAERERLRKEKQDREERAKRREAARKRLAEIEAQKTAENKEVK